MQNKLLTALLAAASFAAFTHAEETGWWFKAGVAVRAASSVELSGSSIALRDGLNAANTATRPPLADVGPAGSFANRLYDNGFVRIDQITQLSREDLEALTGIRTPGLTTFWGYQSNTQRSGNTFTFSRVGSQGLSRTGSETFSLNEDESPLGFGIDLTAGRLLKLEDTHRWDFISGLRIFSFGTETVTGIPLRESYTGNVVRITDTFVVPGVEIATGAIVQPNSPSAPFSGSAGSIQVNELFPNRPASRNTQVLTSGPWTADNIVSVDVETFLYEFRFGAQYSRPIGENSRFLIAPALTLNILDVDLVRNETWVATYSDGSTEELNRFQDKSSSTEFLFGAGIQLGFSTDLSDRWTLEINGAYDFVSEASISAGPNTIKIDPSGFTVGLAFVRAFGGN